MKPKLRLLLALSCFTLYGYAQTDTTAAETVSGRSIYSQDTLQVIHQIFSDKRKNAKYDTNAGLITLGVGGTGILSSLALVFSLSNLLNTKPDLGRLTSVSVGLVSPGLVITGFGVAKRSRFSRKREATVVLAYQQGQPLPPVVMRLLGKRFRKSRR